MSISGFPAGGGGGDVQIQIRQGSSRIAGDLTKFLGSHTLTVGGEYAWEPYNSGQGGPFSGSYGFDAGFTAQNPLSGVAGAGLASFLLGFPSGGSANTVIPIAASLKYPALFAKDEWHASKHLMLHAGIRWESNLPYTERHNLMTYFDPDAVNPILGSAGLSQYHGSVELVSSATRSQRSAINPNWKQFSPRVGLSISLSPKTVANLGYGLLWLPTGLSQQNSPDNSPINSFNTPYIASLDNGLTPANSISNPFPNGLVQPPGRSPAFQGNTLGNYAIQAFPTNPFAYTQQWNVGIQQQIGKESIIHVAYGAAKGTHLPFYMALTDQLPDADLSLGNDLNTLVPNPFAGIISPAFYLGAPQIPAGQLLVKFPQYGGVYSAGAGIGASTYNSLQVTGRRRFGQGASINLAYTWAKLLSNTDTLTAWLEPSEGSAYGGMQDSNNPGAEKSLSSNDVKQRLVLSYLYDIPIGRGKALLSAVPGAVDKIIGGWSLEGISTLQSGFPLSFVTSVNLTNSFGGGSRPNYTPGCRKATKGSAVSRLNKWFNTECFTQPAAFTFGNEPRNDAELRSPGIANWDMSAAKSVGFGENERFKVQFRTEIFNAFNRVQFGYPGTTTGVQGFGVITSQANLPRLVQFGLRFSY
jgi:hypothetical protein